MEGGARRAKKVADVGSREIFWKLLNGPGGKVSK